MTSQERAGSLGTITNTSASKAMIFVRNNNVDDGIITFGL
jgi:hypothetical protein